MANQPFIVIPTIILIVVAHPEDTERMHGNSEKIRRSGILGGSFNPVHTGHLLMAQDALEYFDLDRVLFIPCATPPHKDATALAPARHRLAMLKAAIADTTSFEICPVEIERKGLSYSIDTVIQLQSTYPKDRFSFIIGDDSLIDLPNWHRVDFLLDICDFVTLARPGIRLPPEAPAIEDSRQRNRLLSRRRIGHSMNVSSTEIRKRVARKASIRYLVPEAIEEYINRHRLYRLGNKSADEPSGDITEGPTKTSQRRIIPH